MRIWLALIWSAAAFAQPALEMAIAPPDGMTVNAIASSAEGELYAAGRLNGDAAIVRFNAAGQVVWRMLLGGVAADEATAIAVDAHGAIYLAGATASADFPVVNALQGKPNFTALVRAHGFLTKLSPAGNIAYSTYYYKEGYLRINALRVLPSGEVLLAGGSSQTPWSSLPIPWHGFVAKFSPSGDRVVFHNQLGGDRTSCSGGSSCLSAAPWTSVHTLDVRDTDGWILMAGSTNTVGMATAGAAQTACYCDFQASVGWLGLLDPNGVPQYVTYLSGQGSRLALGNEWNEYIRAVTFDRDGNIRATGVTRLPGFPTTPEAYQSVIEGCVEFCTPRAEVSFYGLIDGVSGALRASSLYGGKAASLRASSLDPSGSMWMMGDETPFMVLFSADAKKVEARWPSPGQAAALVSAPLRDGFATAGPREIRRYRWVDDGPRIYAVGRAERAGRPPVSVVDVAAGDVLDVYTAGYGGDVWLYFDGILAEASPVEGEPGHWRGIVPAGIAERTVIDLTLLAPDNRVSVTRLSTR